MAKSYKARNKRIIPRGRGGRFRRTTAADFGIGECEKCGGFTVQRYNGDPRDEFPDPRLFRPRCFSCNPKTEEELALEAEIKEEQKAASGGGFVGMLEEAAKAVGIKSNE
jgi:hypothetical protein